MVPGPQPAPAAERVQKVLARAGFGSRRRCESLVADGRVTVDGRVVRLGDRVAPGQRLEVDGIPVVTDPGVVAYLLHKPAGVVTTADDPQGRPTVVELVPAEPRVFPVGRLDLDTEGLLVLTNDGDLAHVLMHPRFGVPKTYLAEVVGVPDRRALARLRNGVDLDDGTTAPARARLLGRTRTGAALELTIHEGRNRQVRRMCEAVGHPVTRLVRTAIGPVRDRDLAPGSWRLLGPTEMHALYAAATRGEDQGGARDRG
jgi:23S rRNA pseudouridine2605 synthase